MAAHRTFARGKPGFFVDTSGIDGIGAYMDQLGDAVRGSIRPMAQAGAEVIYERVRMNVQGIGTNTGTLLRSIYQKHMDEESIDGKRSLYKVSWRNGGKREDTDGKLRAAGMPIAFHGHLLEYGWVQRYQVYVNKKGQWRTAIRPEMYGKPPPKRDAGQAAKDAYYLPRPGGPVQWAGYGFMRRAHAALPQAQAAMLETLKLRIATVTRS